MGSKNWNNNVYYSLIGYEGLAFEDICSVKQKPSWWEKLHVFVDGVSPQSFIQNNWDKIIRGRNGPITRRTIKSCPAASTFLSNSILVKFPSDLLIETSDTGEFIWKSFVDGFSVSYHNSNQVNGSHIQRDYIIVKFELPIVFQSDNNRWLFQDCLFEKVQPYRCFNGVGSIKTVNQLNVVCAFPKINKKYYFEKGEPLCSVLFLDNFKSVKEKDLIKQYKRSMYKMTSTSVGTMNNRIS